MAKVVQTTHGNGVFADNAADKADVDSSSVLYVWGGGGAIIFAVRFCKKKKNQIDSVQNLQSQIFSISVP